MNGSDELNRRAPGLGVLVVVTVLGLALTGVGLLASVLLSGQQPAVAAIVAYAVSTTLTLGLVCSVGWVMLARRSPDDALPADASEVSVLQQRQLLDDVRHELKTPITIVRGHLELMDATDPIDVASIRDLSIAELDRMTRLIGDIDLLAAVDGDQFTVNDIDLAALTRRVAGLVTVIPGHAWTVRERGDAVLRGDEDRLLQAWLQLADNAAKYTPPGSAIELGSAATAQGVRLWVSDHGPGIPAAMRHRIFRRFDRGNGRRTVGGSGLGLAIVDTIAKAHLGHCVVTDTPGGGATFTLEIPLGTALALPAPVRAGDVVTQREASG